MHRKVSFIILLQILWFAALPQANAQEANDSILETELELSWDTRLKQSLLSISEEAESNYYNTGICVYDLTADTLLFGYNHYKVMRPASTQKVVTAVSALSLLGANYEYRTRAYYTGSISSDSILNGDIYIVGDFDPAYSLSDLEELAQSIRSLSIKGIRGSLYADISMKDSLLYGNGWCWDDVPCTNMPYLCPLMLERGQIAPFNGKYSTSTTFHPSIYFLQTLGKELSDIGCDTLSYELKTLNNALSAHHFYTKTRTIAELLPHMMKTSDNLYAESMFFHLARINKDRWATWKDGARQVNNVIHKAGADASYVDVADGSGVSLYNYISPQAEVSLLRFAYQNPTIYEPLLHSLPIAGVDGTLKSRMTEAPAYRNIYAKTGTVSGVSTLAGYVMASNGHILAFSIINNGLMKVATGKAFQDRVCQIMAK